MTIASPTESIIQEMTAILVREAAPEAIILFGSLASGEARPGSDVDLLIIESQPFGPGRDRRKELTRLWRALAHFPVGKDLLVYSRDEIERHRHDRNHIIAHALREGRVIHVA